MKGTWVLVKEVVVATARDAFYVLAIALLWLRLKIFHEQMI